eukprot:9221338-Heterocapsa_arctica.AAC.1
MCTKCASRASTDRPWQPGRPAPREHRGLVTPGHPPCSGWTSRNGSRCITTSGTRDSTSPGIGRT